MRKISTLIILCVFFTATSCGEDGANSNVTKGLLAAGSAAGGAYLGAQMSANNKMLGAVIGAGAGAALGLVVGGALK